MLPKGTRYILNPESERIRKLEDRIISVLNTLGYEEIICPLIEYEDVVREGIGRTGYEGIFRLIEPSTGKTMSIREDFTPQIVRAAKNLGRPSMVCYRGSVLRVPKNYLLQSAETLQVGTEIIGDSESERYDGLSLEHALSITSTIIKFLNIKKAEIVVVASHTNYLDNFVKNLNSPLSDDETENFLKKNFLKKNISEVSKYFEKIKDAKKKDIVSALLSVSENLKDFEIDGCKEIIQEMEIFEKCKDYIHQNDYNSFNIIFDMANGPKRAYHKGFFYEIFVNCSNIISGGKYIISGEEGRGFGIDVELASCIT